MLVKEHTLSNEDHGIEVISTGENYYNSRFLESIYTQKYDYQFAKLKRGKVKT